MKNKDNGYQPIHGPASPTVLPKGGSEVGKMKNKDKYTLTSLNITASYLTDGCGKKVENMRYLTVKDGEKVLLSELVNGKPIERLMRWMEEDG